MTIETLPDNVIEEIDIYLAMDDETLLKSYKLYGYRDFSHTYGDIVLEEIKKEMNIRGLPI